MPESAALAAGASGTLPQRCLAPDGSGTGGNSRRIRQGRRALSLWQRASTVVRVGQLAPGGHWDICRGAGRGHELECRRR